MGPTGSVFLAHVELVDRGAESRGIEQVMFGIPAEVAVNSIAVEDVGSFEEVGEFVPRLATILRFQKRWTLQPRTPARWRRSTDRSRHLRLPLRSVSNSCHRW